MHWKASVYKQILPHASVVKLAKTPTLKIGRKGNRGEKLGKVSEGFKFESWLR